MKESRLTSRIYWDKEFHRKESSILEKCWIFVGMADELPDKNDWLVKRFWGEELIIYNNGDSISAFQNVCPHRLSKLFNKKKGNSKLICPYHGWTFSGSGNFLGGPNSKKNDYYELRCKLNLRKWVVEKCGHFLFAKKNIVLGSLREYLGESIHNTLLACSESFSTKIDTNPFIVKANWKIVVENTLEAYHVSKVHPDTFAKLGASGSDFQFHSFHSTWNASLRESFIKSWKNFNKAFESRPMSFDNYRHIHVFPNLTIASTFGLSFGVQEIQPISASETSFVSHSYFTKLNKKTKKQDLLKAPLMELIKDFNQQVFKEDKDICELAQSGAEQVDQPYYFLDPIENRIEHFQNACIEII